TSSAGSVVGMNIFVSLLAGLAVFPVVFALGMEPTEGPGLLFMVLPAAFGEIPFGAFFLSLFLILFLFATLTSSFSLYEIIVSAFTADGKRSRTTVTMMLGAVLFIVAIPAALSDSLLSDVSIAGKSIFDATDYLVSNIMLPLGSLLIALFIAYKMDKTLVKEQYHIGSTSNSSLYGLWRVLMYIVVPLTIIVVYLNMLGFRLQFCSIRSKVVCSKRQLSNKILYDLFYQVGVKVLIQLLCTIFV